MPFNPEALLELRRRQKFSGYKLARILDVTPQTIYNWEHGRNVPNIDTLDRLYVVARQGNHEDLEFYVSPNVKSVTE